MKHGKAYNKSAATIDKDHLYSTLAAARLAKAGAASSKFDHTVEVAMLLGVDPRKADQALRGTASLPHGTCKTKRVLVFCTSDKEEEARAAGADHVGLEDYIKKVSEGWTDVDVVIATPNVMAQIAKLGRILGPRGLMPNPKVGTVTLDVGNAVTDVKKGKVAFKVDKYGIIHSSIGRVSFDQQQIQEERHH